MRVSRSGRRRTGRTEYEAVTDHVSNGRPAADAMAQPGSGTWANLESETVRSPKRPGYREGDSA